MFRTAIAGLLLTLFLTTDVSACNVPVFRYALERWKSDAYDVIVFHNDELSEQQTRFVQSLTKESKHTNIQVQSKDLRDGEQDSYRELWKTVSASKNPNLPYVVIQSKVRDRTINAWHGSINEAIKLGITQSPARKEITNRLLQGDSVVWLILKSNNDAKNSAARKMLQASTKSLSTKIKIPEGVGLPGSELFSEVPLLVQFSILEIDGNDAKEQFLIKLLSEFQVKPYANGDPLIVPIFGRGRALEVIPASQLDGRLVEDLTIFLSGPCSCQVKDRNPGFDLLFSAKWDDELFGDDGERPPVLSVSDPKSAPRTLTIPPGRKK